jgi:transposase
MHHDLRIYGLKKRIVKEKDKYATKILDSRYFKTRTKEDDFLMKLSKIETDHHKESYMEYLELPREKPA